MKVEFYTFNDELFCRTESGTEKLSVSSDIIKVVYDKISEFYPEAFKALNKEYARLMDEKYKRFRIVNRFLKCNFGIIDKTLDLIPGRLTSSGVKALSGHPGIYRRTGAAGTGA